MCVCARVFALSLSLSLSLSLRGVCKARCVRACMKEVYILSICAFEIPIFYLFSLLRSSNSREMKCAHYERSTQMSFFPKSSSRRQHHKNGETQRFFEKDASLLPARVFRGRVHVCMCSVSAFSFRRRGRLRSRILSLSNWKRWCLDPPQKKRERTLSVCEHHHRFL